MSDSRLDDKGWIAACPHCGQRNRTPFSHLGETGTCGRCKNALPPPSEPVEAGSEAQFQDLLATSPLPVVVDFWAPWCGPCLQVAPELVKVAAAASGRFLIAKVNTEALPGLGARYGVQSIPTLAVFRQGREVTRTMGARPAAAITAFVQGALAS